MFVLHLQPIWTINFLYKQYVQEHQLWSLLLNTIMCAVNSQLMSDFCYRIVFKSLRVALYHFASQKLWVGAEVVLQSVLQWQPFKKNPLVSRSTLRIVLLLLLLYKFKMWQQMQLSLQPFSWYWVQFGYLWQSLCVTVLHSNFNRLYSTTEFH